MTCVLVCVLLSVMRQERESVRAAADRQGADEAEAIEKGETALRGSGGGVSVVAQCGCACGLRYAQAGRCFALVA